ncbi:hypothetical protein ES703_105826 [subsurface metagenome]
MRLSTRIWFILSEWGLMLLDLVFGVTGNAVMQMVILLKMSTCVCLIM